MKQTFVRFFPFMTLLVIGLIFLGDLFDDSCFVEFQRCHNFFSIRNDPNEMATPPKSHQIFGLFVPHHAPVL